MTQEEFIKKVQSDESLAKEFEADPGKVIAKYNVELSEDLLEDIAGGKSNFWDFAQKCLDKAFKDK